MSKSDMKRENEKRFRSKMNRKHWRDHRLRELEKQLEFAESRCGTLKQQLDCIKVLYGGKPSFHDNDEVAEFCNKEASQEALNGVRLVSLDDFPPWNNIAHEFSGENRGRNFLPQTVSYTNTTRESTNSSNKRISSKSSIEKKEITNGELKETLTQKSRVKLAKGRRKKSFINSKHKLKSKGTEPRFNNATCQTSWPLWQDPIVEIYKNTAANIDSESAADVRYKNKRQKLENHMKSDSSKNFSTANRNCNQSNEQLIPATKLKAFTSFKSLDEAHNLKEESVQTDLIMEKESKTAKNEKSASMDEITKAFGNSEKIYYEPEPVKNYCQPTISSKKKRVERNLLASLNCLNLKSIPFIAATSTAPSHNIGINIQQVLSIMKKRQPKAVGEIIPMTLSDQVIGENGAQYVAGSRDEVNEKNEDEVNFGDLVPDVTLGELKKDLVASKSFISEKKISENGLNSKIKSKEEVADDHENAEWNLKVHKLKKVLVFLHEDFTFLNQKYKRLQKKLAKRNINKMDAKDELAEIERDLVKKEEEITIVIGLYKEVLNLRKEVKKYQEKYNFVVCERALMMDGIKQSNSTHAQMSKLLRKIQQFQDQLKQ